MSPASDKPGTTWEFLNEVQKVWKGVEIEFFVLFSLALQVILIFFAGHRKRVVSWWLSLLLWLAYWLADLVAVYTLGLLYKNQNRVDFDPRGPPPDRCDDHLLAFWSPFLILHLGGPDTITSYSLEDNELWLRHLLTVVFQATLAALVIGKSLPGTSLFLPAALLFTAGFLKYIERTLALRSASMSCLRKSLLPSPGPDPKVLAAIVRAKNVREVDAIKKELAAIDEKLALIEEELAAKKKELLAKQEQLDPVRNDLASVREQLNDTREEKKAAVKEGKLAARLGEISAREEELTAKEKKLAAKDKELAIEKGYLDSRKVELDNQKEEHTARKKELTKRGMDLESELIKTKEELAARRDDARKKAALLVVAINPDDAVETLEYSTVVRQAHRFFLTFRRLIVDLRPSSEHQNDSRSFFLQSRPVQAFKVIELELAFMYEMLHTKAALIHGVAGRLIRSITCAISLTTLLLFLNINKDGCQRTNVIITYVLLGGALALETYAIGLMILSFWTVIHLEGHKLAKKIFAIAKLIQPETRPRWSNSMAQYNLIDLCLRDRPTTWRKIVKYLGVEELWDQHWYTAHTKVQDGLKELIFREIANCTGEWTLQRKDDLEAHVPEGVPAEFDKSILMWHIATDLCYYRRGLGFFATKYSPPDISRDLSNYMLYLLVMRPFMLPAGLGQIKITIADTCAHAKRFFEEKTKYTCWERDCWKLLNKNVDSWDSWAVEMTGDKTHSVLFEASKLAQELFKIEPAEKRWEVINGVWVEMLAYAASRCRVNFHAKQLTAGGELLTFVWLLMAHLKKGEQ